MAGDAPYGSFDEFFPFYVAMHSRASTRWIHLTGTLSGAAVALYGVARGRPKWLGAMPGLGYGFAWPSHFLIEHNNPASFGHPLWSFRGDVKMIGLMLRGRDAELGAMATAWLARARELPDAAGPPDRAGGADNPVGALPPPAAPARTSA